MGMLYTVSILKFYAIQLMTSTTNKVKITIAVILKTLVRLAPSDTEILLLSMWIDTVSSCIVIMNKTHIAQFANVAKKSAIICSGS